MYDHEYEWQILGFLRILKYIWQRNKSILADLVRDYRCGEIDTEDIFELSVILLVEYICVDYLPEDDPNDFYGEEYTCYLLMESELDDYLTLIAQIETLRFRITECTGRNKLRDAVEMFMGNVLPHFKSQTQLSKFPRFLLGIPNNDDFFKESHNRLRMSHRELLEHLKDKEPSYYYTDVLVESGKTLSDFINGR